MLVSGTTLGGDRLDPPSQSNSAFGTMTTSSAGLSHARCGAGTPRDEGRGGGMSTIGAAIESLEAAEAAFRRDHPRYAQTALIDKLRASDFARLDRGGHVGPP